MLEKKLTVEEIGQFLAALDEIAYYLSQHDVETMFPSGKFAFQKLNGMGFNLHQFYKTADEAHRAKLVDEINRIFTLVNEGHANSIPNAIQLRRKAGW